MSLVQPARTSLIAGDDEASTACNLFTEVTNKPTAGGAVGRGPGEETDKTENIYIWSRGDKIAHMQMLMQMLQYDDDSWALFFSFSCGGGEGGGVTGVTTGLGMEAVWYHITYVWGSLGSFVISNNRGCDCVIICMIHVCSCSQDIPEPDHSRA